MRQEFAMTARLKTLLLTTSFLGGLAGVALADPATLVTTTNLRAGPGTEYPSRITIPGGTTIDVRGCDGAWCVARYGGYQGYVAQSLVAAGDEQEPAIAAVPDDGYYYDEVPAYGYGYGYGGSAYGGYRRDWQDQNRRGNWQGRRDLQQGNRGNIQQGNRGNWQVNRGGGQVNPGGGNWQGRSSGQAGGQQNIRAATPRAQAPAPARAAQPRQGSSSSQ
jgi:uncharacterized protein YraI